MDGDGCGVRITRRHELEGWCGALVGNEMSAV